MMTGALLGGSPVDQAAKLQSESVILFPSFQRIINHCDITMLIISTILVVIMFMISACTALAAITASVLTLSVVVDREHRIRDDRVTDKQFIIWRWRDQILGMVTFPIYRVWEKMTSRWRSTRESDAGERQRLLS